MQPLLVAKAVAVVTAAEFLTATVFYFRRRSKVHATLLMTVFILSALIVHLVFLVQADETPLPQIALALVFFGISNGLFWFAVMAHGQARPSSVFGESAPETLVTWGPYKVIRHPFYLAYVTGFLGSAFVGNHWIVFVATIGLFLCYNLAAKNEERLLANHPGPISQGYSEYLRKSWRWLPFVW